MTPAMAKARKQKKRGGKRDPRGHVVALGGGGFSMEPENPLLDDFILSLARRDPARVCFIPTASADSPHYIARFYRAFSARCLPADLTLNDPPSLPRRPALTSDLPEFVAEHDVLYVGGGNTANLLALWRTHGLDELLRSAWRDGAVLAGISAGMICWFDGGLTDSFGGLAPLLGGVGVVEGMACPHYDGEPGRREAFQELIAERGGVGYAADDGAALHFAGTELAEVVSSRPHAAAYRLSVRRGKLTEEKLPTRYLGKRRGGKK
jgi:dipeptidase E